MEQDQFNPYPNEIQEGKRPAFLTVLCIITFVISGIGALLGLKNLFAGPDMQSQSQLERTYNDIEKAMGPNIAETFMDFIDISIMNHTQMTLISLFISISCVVGAYLMFNLNKKGFFVYAFSTVIAIVYPYFYFGDNMFWIIIGTMLAVFSIAFVVMYGVNRKHMK